MYTNFKGYSNTFPASVPNEVNYTCKKQMKTLPFKNFKFVLTRIYNIIHIKI